MKTEKQLDAEPATAPSGLPMLGVLALLGPLSGLLTLGSEAGSRAPPKEWRDSAPDAATRQRRRRPPAYGQETL